jgi:hypothetical protein
MASSSAITTRMGTLVSSSFQGGWPGAGSARFCSQTVEQLVLFAFELLDRGLHLGSMARVGLSMALRLVVLPIGKRCLGHERPDAGLVGGLVEMSGLLVRQDKLLPKLLQPIADLLQSALDHRPRHSRIVGVGRGVFSLRLRSLLAASSSCSGGCTFSHPQTDLR